MLHKREYKATGTPRCRITHHSVIALANFLRRGSAVKNNLQYLSKKNRKLENIIASVLIVYFPGLYPVDF